MSQLYGLLNFRSKVSGSFSPVNDRLTLKIGTTSGGASEVLASVLNNHSPVAFVTPNGVNTLFRSGPDPRPTNIEPIFGAVPPSTVQETMSLGAPASTSFQLNGPSWSYLLLIA